MIETARIYKSGRSAIVVLPAAVMSAAELQIGDKVYYDIDADKSVVMRKLSKLIISKED